MNEMTLAIYWSEIPVGRENAVTYENLCEMWSKSERSVRSILHELSSLDNGDDFVLIRSSGGKGFYKTDNPEEIEAYKRECLHKGRSVFAPIKKINRVLKSNKAQFSLENNLRVVRESCGLKQKDVCKILKRYDRAFDTALLSKMENGVCLPTSFHLGILAEIYACEPFDLVNDELLY